MGRPKFGVTFKDRFYDKVFYSPDGCWYWIGATRGVATRPYGVMQVDGKSINAQRVSYIIHHGTFPDELHVCHHCDRPLCVNPQHLFLGTRSDNMRDKISKGRGNMPFGENSSRAKLSNEQVLAIRSLKGHLSSRQVSKLFNYSQVAVCQIWKRKIWKHL